MSILVNASTRTVAQEISGSIGTNRTELRVYATVHGAVKELLVACSAIDESLV